MIKLLFILMQIPAFCSFGQETKWLDIDYVGDGESFSATLKKNGILPQTGRYAIKKP